MEAWAALLLSGGAFVGAVASLIASLRNGRRIEDIHISINSRMDQLLVAHGKEMKAEGVAQERANPT